MAECARVGEVLASEVITTMSSSPTRRSELEYTCELCGRRVEPIALEVPGPMRAQLGEVRYVRGTCQCIQAGWREEELARAVRERQQMVERVFSLSELGPRFAASTFESWVPREGAHGAYAAARAYVDEWEANRTNGTGLWIFGPPGNGKTHLAGAIVHGLMEQGVPCVMRPVAAFLRRLKEAWDDGAAASEHALVRALCEVDLLVLDDVGAEAWRDWKEDTLHHIIDERYRWKRPVVLTSNQSPTEMQDKLGFRSVDRLIETCIVIKNSATSYRHETGRKRAAEAKGVSRDTNG